LKTIVGNLARSDAEAYFEDLVWLKSVDRATLYTPDYVRRLAGFTPFEVVGPYYRECGGSDPLARSQYADEHIYLTDDVLMKVDRMSMAHALEVRPPLLDYRILEFAAQLPRSLKTGYGTGKLLLRKLAAKRVPPGIHRAPKRGFSIPASQWLRSEL